MRLGGVRLILLTLSGGSRVELLLPPTVYNPRSLSFLPDLCLAIPLRTVSN